MPWAARQQPRHQSRACQRKSNSPFPSSTIAKTQHHSPAASPTLSSTSSTPASSSSSSTSLPTPSTDCPDSNFTTYTPPDVTGGPGNNQFLKYCDQDAGGDNVAEAYVMSFDLCIDMCSNYNSIHGNTSCDAVSYLPGGSPPGNCWAKANANGVYHSSSALTSQRASAAFLQ